jgi:hypothetical protein
VNRFARELRAAATARGTGNHCRITTPCSIEHQHLRCPCLAEFNKWRERGVGAVMLISFVAASVGGLLVTFGKKIWAVIVGT